MIDFLDNDEALQRDEVGMIYARWHDHVLRATRRPIFQRSGGEIEIVGAECGVAAYRHGRAVDMTEFLGGLPEGEQHHFAARRLALMLGNCRDLDADFPGFVVFRLDKVPPETLGPVRRLMLGAAEALGEDGFDPARLVCRLGSEQFRSGWLVDMLRSAGIAPALDGFGRGADDLHLITGPLPGFVTIDPSWFRRIADEPPALKLLGQLVEALRRQGTRAMVDGIDSAAHLRAALAADVTLLQGDFLAPARLVGTPVEARTRRLDELLGAESKVVPLFGPDAPVQQSR